MAPNSDSSKSTCNDQKSDLVWKTFIKFLWPQENCGSSIIQLFSSWLLLFYCFYNIFFFWLRSKPYKADIANCFENVFNSIPTCCVSWFVCEMVSDGVTIKVSPSRLNELWLLLGATVGEKTGVWTGVSTRVRPKPGFPMRRNRNQGPILVHICIGRFETETFVFYLFIFFIFFCNFPIREGDLKTGLAKRSQ